MWKSLRCSCYAYYLLYLLTVTPETKKSDLSADDETLYLSLAADLVQYHETDRDQGRKLLNSWARTSLVHVMAEFPAERVRDLIISAGTYTAGGFRNKLPAKSKLSRSEDHTLCLKKLKRTTDGTSEDKSVSYVNQGNGSSEKRNKSNKNKESKSSSENPERKETPSVESNSSVTVSSDTVTSVPSQSVEISKAGTVLFEAPEPPADEARKPVEVYSFVPQSKTQVKNEFEPAQYPPDEDADVVAMTNEPTVWHVIEEGMKAALLVDSSRLVLIPDLARSHSLSTQNALSVLRQSSKNQISMQDLERVMKSHMQFGVYIRYETTMVDQCHTNPDGMCCWRALYQAFQRAHAGLCWAVEETGAHDVNLKNPASASAFCLWMERIRDSLLAVVPRKHAPPGLQQHNCDWVVERMDGVIAHVKRIIDTGVPIQLPFNFWGSVNCMDVLSLIQDPTQFFPAQFLNLKTFANVSFGLLAATTVHACGRGDGSSYTLDEIKDIFDAPNMFVLSNAHFYPGPPMVISGPQASFYPKREEEIMRALSTSCRTLFPLLTTLELPPIPTYLVKPRRNREAMEQRVKKLQEELAQAQEELNKADM